VSSEEGRKFA
jgi:hypothetical protein